MIFVAILFFIILIVVHEYGHFLAAKRNGVEVEEFGIGFPPKLYGKKLGKGIWESYYTINLLPLGGFVRLKGEADADKTKGSYGAASFWVKTKIILAGVFMNFVVAWLIFTVLAFTGIPSIVENQFSRSSAEQVRQFTAVGIVDEGSVAEEIGIELGDDIVSVGDVEIDSAQTLLDTTKLYAGKEVTIVFRDHSDGFSENSVQAQLPGEEEEGPILGVGPADIDVKKYNFIDAIIVGAGTVLQLSAEIYRALGNLLSSLFGAQFSEAAENVSGPIGVFVILNNSAVFGFEFLIFFIGFISLTLAVMNALPIPALDGGKLAVSGLFKIMKRPLTREVESAIHGTGFVVLMGLILLISYIDVQRFF